MSAPKIPDGPSGQRLRDKFDAYNLDPNNPDNWALLFNAMVEGKEPGRPKKWTDHMLSMLNAVYHRVQRKHPDKSEADVCRFIVKSGEFPKVKWETLQRRLHDFRNPARNGELKFILDGIMKQRGLESAADRERVLFELTMAGMDVFAETDAAGEVLLDETGVPNLRFQPYVVPKRK
jgi:hypothetical protein